MIGPTELLLILAGVVLFYGGKKLPKLGEGLGKGISEFKKAMKGDEGPDAEKKQIPGQEGRPEQK